MLLVFGPAIPKPIACCRWNAQKEAWSYYVETEVSGHSKSLGCIKFPKQIYQTNSSLKIWILNKLHMFLKIWIWSLLRDRVKASFSEATEWETEESGIDMTFNMETPLEGRNVVL